MGKLTLFKLSVNHPLVNKSETHHPSKQAKSIDLSIDPLMYILSFFPAHDLAKFCLVNKDFRTASGKEWARRLPFLKQLMSVFKQRTPHQIRSWIEESHLSMRQTVLAGLTPRVTYGKICKSYTGKVRIAVSKEINKDEANFAILELLKSKKKPITLRNRTLSQKILNVFRPNSQAYNTHYTLMGLKVIVLNKELSSELRGWLKDGQQFLDHLFLKSEASK